MIKKEKQIPLYKELDKLITDGSQYFDLGFKANQDTRIELDARFNTVGSTVRSRLFGDRYDSGTRAFAMATGTGFATKQILYIGFGGNYYNNANDIPTSYMQERHIISADRNGAYWGDTYYKTYTTSSNFECDYTFLIGTYRNAGALADSFAPLDIYGCKFYQSGVLSHDYVPVIRISDNVVGLYDKVDNTFIEKSVGNDVVAGTETGTIYYGTIAISNTNIYQMFNTQRYSKALYINNSSNASFRTDIGLRGVQSYSWFVKFKMNKNSTGNQALLGSFYSSSSRTSRFYIGINADNKIYCTIDKTAEKVSANALSLNTIYELEIKRVGNTTELYLDGEELFTINDYTGCETTVGLMEIHNPTQSGQTANNNLCCDFYEFRYILNGAENKKYIPVYDNESQLYRLYETHTNTYMSVYNDATGIDGLRLKVNQISQVVKKDYVKLDCLESTSNGFLETGRSLNGKASWKIHLDFELSNITDNGVIIGSWNQNTHTFYFRINEGYFRYRIDSSTQPNICPCVANHRYIVDIEQKNGKITFTIDGVVEATVNATSKETYGLYIMATHASDSSTSGKYTLPQRMKLYNFKFYVNDVLENNYIPVYDVQNNRYCCYDTVQDTNVSVWNYNNLTGNKKQIVFD